MKVKRRFGATLYLLSANAGRLAITPYCNNLRKNNVYYFVTKINPKRNLISKMRGKNGRR